MHFSMQDSKIVIVILLQSITVSNVATYCMQNSMKTVTAMAIELQSTNNHFHF